jgi:hypothetical protein
MTTGRSWTPSDGYATIFPMIFLILTYAAFTAVLVVYGAQV